MPDLVNSIKTLIILPKIGLLINKNFENIIINKQYKIESLSNCDFSMSNFSKI